MADSYLTASLEETPRYEGAPSTEPYRIATERFWFPVDSGILTSGVQHLDRANELRGLLAPPVPLIDGHEPGGSLSQRFYPNNLVVMLAMAGLVPTITEGDATNEVQTLSITGTPTGGSFTITTPAALGAETTAAIPYNATAAQVRAALEALDGIREGDVTVAGGPLPDTAVTVTFTGQLAGQDVDDLTTTDSFTGGTAPASAIAETTPGATGSVTDPDGNGVPAGAYLVTFAKRETAVAQTAQILVVYGPQAVYLKGQGYAISSLSVNAAGEVSADLMGLVVKPTTDPGLTPAHDAPSIVPLRRGDLTLTWLGGGARVQDFSVQIANAIERGEDLGIQSYYPKHMEHTGEPTRLTGSITKGLLDEDDYNALITAESFSATARWLSTKQVGSSGKPYGVWIEMPAAVYTGGDPEPLTNSRRFGATFDYGAFLDESTDRDFVISVVCGVESVATYS